MFANTPVFGSYNLCRVALMVGRLLCHCRVLYSDQALEFEKGKTREGGVEKAPLKALKLFSIFLNVNYENCYKTFPYSGN